MFLGNVVNVIDSIRRHQPHEHSTAEDLNQFEPMSTYLQRKNIL